MPRPNLVNQVSAELRQLIVSGALSAGDKLPSEAELTSKYSVSRTVIREALAALRSDGLVEARQGAGVFVLEGQSSSLTGLSAVNPERISSVVEMLELRAGVEIEAAGLAAIRCSPAQEERIFEVLEAFISKVRQKQSTSELDRSFHLAVANATNNPRFAEFLELMGASVIPRLSLKDGSEAEPATSTEYLEQIHQEHMAIAEAISQRDESAARDAMRLHLKGSQQRYRKLLRP
ncbi:FadR family transcriptional regulator [Leucothrix arctica]|uniref:FadR family transcriptional regulator n=1 Tax=Leucothrix arctica TaxID=1481894 RepID=A0A317CTA4_9GAMM|nr:FadR family transcriptional regulator [Leucothrix arctica]